MRDKMDEWLTKAYSEPVLPPDGLKERLREEMGAMPAGRTGNRVRRLEIAAAVLLLCGGMAGMWLAAERTMDTPENVSRDVAVTGPTEKPQTVQEQNGTDGDTGENGKSETDQEERDRGMEPDNLPSGQDAADDVPQLYRKLQEGAQNRIGTGQGSFDSEQGQDFHEPETSPQAEPETASETAPTSSPPELPVALPAVSSPALPTASPEAGSGDYMQLCSVEEVYYSDVRGAGDNNSSEVEDKKPEETEHPGGTVTPAPTQLPVVLPSTDESVPVRQADSDVVLFSQRVIFSESELSALRERAEDLEAQRLNRMDTTQLLSRLSGYGDRFFQSNVLCIHTVLAKRGEGLDLAAVKLQKEGGQETIVLQVKRTGQASEPETTGYLSCVVSVPRSILQDNTKVVFKEVTD